MSTSMEDGFRRAGVSPELTRLIASTDEALRLHKGDTEKVAVALMRLLLNDVRLLNALLGLNVRARVDAFVRDRLAGRGSQGISGSPADLDPTPAASLEGASHMSNDSQRSTDRPSTPLPDASRTDCGSQHVHDRSGSLVSGGESHVAHDSQPSRDLPSGTPLPKGGAARQRADSQASGGRPTPPASVNPALKAAAGAVVRTAADYQIPGVPGRRLGSITRFDRLNLSINKTFLSELEHAISRREVDGLIKWPDDITPLERVVSPAVLAEIRQEIEQAKDRAIQSARSLSHGNA